MENHFPLLFRQIPEGDIRPDAQIPGDILHQGPHQRLPGEDGALVDGQGFIRHQSGFIHHMDDARSVAAGAGTLAVEGQLLSTGAEEVLAAFGADQLLLRGDRHGGRKIMPVRAAMAAQTRKHQPQALEQLGPRTEGGADAGHRGPLMQGEGGRDIQHIGHVRPGGLGHAPAGIGGEGFEITAGALGVQDAQGEGGFAGAGNPGDADDFMQRDIHVNILQVVNPGSPNQDFVGGFMLHGFSAAARACCPLRVLSSVLCFPEKCSGVQACREKVYTKETVKAIYRPSPSAQCIARGMNSPQADAGAAAIFF